MNPDLLSKLESIFSHATVRYKRVDAKAIHLPMSDGTRIAVDVLLPAERKEGETFPTVMVMTRYWRSFALRFIPSPPGSAPISANYELWNTLITRGIAVVAVDARGSGASFGAYPYPWSERELADYGEVARWVTQQRWSNGVIGASGNSYEGSTAQLLPAFAPDITHAILSQEMELDPYEDIAMPGGIFNQAFVRAWSDSNHRQDNNKTATFFPRLLQLLLKGVRPVDEDKDGASLRAAIADHASNPSVYAAMDGITYREDTYLPGVTMDDFAVFKRREAIEASGAVLFNWGSWMDSRTAESVLNRFNTFSNPQIAIISASSHDGSQNADPYAAGQPPSPTPAEMREIQARYFSTFLKADAATPRKRLIYYTMGAGEWRESDVWPPAGIQSERWYIGAGKTLSRALANSDGADPYRVDFTASTGKFNRWVTGLVKPVRYGNRAAQIAKLLSYTSAPLEADTEITGHPQVQVMLQSTHADGALYIYLQCVDAHGVVRYLTEGQLRLIHRKVADSAPYWTGGIYHSCRHEDAAPFPVGQFETVSMSLYPLSVVVPRGSRFCLSIAGHDSDTFRRIPAQGTPTFTVDWKGTWLDLPVKRA
ncbi:MAG: CocE/NonD family hydrolase [Chloroflexota bacterium]|nr:CocE/NonD family hydrolase [Chloroflexota bacterium]